MSDATKTTGLQLRSRISKAGELELSVGIKLGFHEPAEERGGGRSVETMIVIQDSHPHAFRPKEAGRPYRLPQNRGQMQVGQRRHL